LTPVERETGAILLAMASDDQSETGIVTGRVCAPSDPKRWRQV
jgi:hypothetical protein